MEISEIIEESLSKVKSMHFSADEEVINFAQQINQCVQEINNYLSAEVLYS